MRRLLKFLHELGSVGVMGALACHLALLVVATGRGPHDYALIRHGIERISVWVLLPSLACVLISGFFAMAATRAFQDAGWAWIKALLGVSMLEGTLGAVQGTARDLAAMAAQMAAGEPEPELYREMLRREWWGLWVILALSAVNIGLAVWRPRLYR